MGRPGGDAGAGVALRICSLRVFATSRRAPRVARPGRACAATRNHRPTPSGAVGPTSWPDIRNTKASFIPRLPRIWPRQRRADSRWRITRSFIKPRRSASPAGRRTPPRCLQDFAARFPRSHLRDQALDLARQRLAGCPAGAAGRRCAGGRTGNAQTAGARPAARASLLAGPSPGGSRHRIPGCVLQLPASDPGQSCRRRASGTARPIGHCLSGPG